jgi:hypothetical protein
VSDSLPRVEDDEREALMMTEVRAQIVHMRSVTGALNGR